MKAHLNKSVPIVLPERWVAEQLDDDEVVLIAEEGRGGVTINEKLR